MRLARIALIAVFSLLCAPLWAQEASIATLDEKNGFRGARFGTAVTEFKDLKLIEDGYWKFFRRTNEVLYLGGGELTEVGYGFYKDELGAVIVKAAGSLNCESVLHALTASYGKATQPDKGVKSYFWDGRKVTLSFDHDEQSNTCYATFISVQEHERATADEQMAAEQNKRQLPNP